MAIILLCTRYLVNHSASNGAFTTFSEDVAREIDRTKSIILFTNEVNITNAVAGAEMAKLKVQYYAKIHFYQSLHFGPSMYTFQCRLLTDEHLSQYIQRWQNSSIHSKSLSIFGPFYSSRPSSQLEATLAACHILP